MNDRTDEQLRALLTAIDDIVPEPPPLPSGAPTLSKHRRPLPVAVGAFAGVLIVVGLVALAVRAGVNENQDVAIAPTAAPATTTLTGEPGRETPLPRYTIGLPGWSVVAVNESDLSATAIFSENSEDGARDGAVISVWSDHPNESPGTGYAATLASFAEAEYLGTARFDGITAEAFLFGGEDPDYQFVWQNTETVTVQVVVFRADYDDAKRVVASIVPITEESWVELVAQFPPPDMPTTTMAPDAPDIRNTEPPDVTTTTMP